MLDRCVMTTADIVIGNVVLWSLFLADFIFTRENMARLMSRGDDGYRYEFNVLHRVAVRRFGLRGFYLSFPMSVAILAAALVFWPFITAPLIGFIFCMVTCVHLPNYIELRRRR